MLNFIFVKHRFSKKHSQTSNLPHQETVSPVPADSYDSRFRGTIFGCIFHPPMSESDERSVFLRAGLTHALCTAFGEEREPEQEKFEAFFGTSPEGNRAETHLRGWHNEEGMRREFGKYGIAVYGLGLFKTLMDKWNMPSWEMLVSTFFLIIYLNYKLIIISNVS